MTKCIFGKKAGFSLIEVAIAIGVIGFSLVAIMGLLPTGISTQQRSQEEARAASALNMVTSAVESLRRVNAGQGSVTWAFPNYFSDNGDPVNNPTILWVGQNDANGNPYWQYTFFVDEGGLIIPTGDTTTFRRQTLYVKVYPPRLQGQAVRVYAAVAWPYKTTDSSTTTPAQMVGRQGFVDELFAYSPKATF
jgi:type II secretory pathway pseudopilin PulG